MLNKEKEENGMIHIHHSSHDSYRARELGIFENGLLDSDVFLQVSSSSSIWKQVSAVVVCTTSKRCVLITL